MVDDSYFLSYPFDSLKRQNRENSNNSLKIEIQAGSTSFILGIVQWYAYLKNMIIGGT